MGDRVFIDANGNGKLETAEKVEMIKARMAKSERFAEMVNKRFGGDDGVASDEEIAAFAEKMGSGRRPGGEGRKPGGKKPGGKKPEGAGDGFKPVTE